MGKLQYKREGEEKMKKLCSMILALVMVSGIFLTGCGSKSGSTQTTAAPATAAAATAAETTAAQTTAAETKAAETTPAETEAPKQAEWPKDPITVIVGQKAGGANDLMARTFAQYVQPHLGVPVTVLNVDGGSGMVGLFDFLEREPDGNTLFVLNQPKLSMGYLINGNDYSLDDFAFITGPQMDWPTISVPMDSPYQTVAELIEDIKARPGEVSMGVMVNTGAHFTGLIFLNKLGLDANVVTYEGGNDYRLAMAGGHVDFGFGNANGDHASFADQIRPLAIVAPEPISFYPDVPLANDELKEYGVELPIGLGSFRNIMVRKEVAEQYPERYQILVDAFRDMMENDKDFIEHMESAGDAAITSYRSPEDTLQFNKTYEQTILEIADQIAD